MIPYYNLLRLDLTKENKKAEEGVQCLEKSYYYIVVIRSSNTMTTYTHFYLQLIVRSSQDASRIV
jgi:hypothetical protein